MPITFSAERQSVAQYSLTNSSLATISNSAAAECQAFLKRGNLPTDDPDWLRGYFAGEAEHLRAYMLHEGSALAGIAHFLSRDWSLKCYLGELPIADFPLRRLLLLGPTPRFPDDQAAYDLLFSDLARSSHSCQAVFVADIPIRSYFWDYLQQSEVIRKHFLAYQPEPPSPHLILRFGRSFDEYMAKFSSKHRNSLRREVRKIREGSLGEMRFVRFESPQDVPVFLDGAVEVSKKTYQWTLHQRGLRLTDRVRQRLMFGAEHGWMRSYLLYCSGRPCAFLMGFQYKGLYLPHEMGFDPALARFSVGTVLLLLAIEDLFEHNRPEVLDFGGYATYKEMLSTESYLQGSMFLFRRGLYPRLIRGSHRACVVTSKVASACLDRLGLKTRIRQRLRGLGKG